MQPIQSINKLIGRLWIKIGSFRRRQFWFLLVLMIFGSFAEIISIGAVLPFLGVLTSPNRIFEHQAAQPFIQVLGLTSSDQLMLPLTIVFALTALIASALRVLLLWASLRLSFSVGADLSNGIYRRTLYQPYAVHIARNSSEIISSISIKTGEVIFYVLMPAMNLISASVMLIAILVALIYIIPGIALAAFGGFSLVYAFINSLARKRLKTDSKNIAIESTNTIKSLQEGLGGIRDVLIDGSQEVFCTNYRNANQSLRRAQGSNQFISSSPRYCMEALAMMVFAVLAYLLSRQPEGIVAAIPMLAALALGMQRLLPALQQAYGAWTTIQSAQSSLHDALCLLDQSMPADAEKSVNTMLSFQRHIRLRQVSFRYSDQTPWVLRSIDISIAKGSRVGFIGTTGSGKSTLLDIIMGLLQPTEGLIEIDGQPIDHGLQRAWQRHIAHVPQSIFLIDASVEENIAFGVPKEQISHERVRQAAKQAQIAELIETWPSQYKTSVGERGIKLSGGQRQRIGIARALYKQCDVIIFDESTSALDSDTELAVMHAIETISNNITILIIAHRLSTLKNCTKIIEIADGIIHQIE